MNSRSAGYVLNKQLDIVKLSTFVVGNVDCGGSTSNPRFTIVLQQNSNQFSHPKAPSTTFTYMFFNCVLLDKNSALSFTWDTFPLTPHTLVPPTNILQHK